MTWDIWCSYYLVNKYRCTSKAILHFRGSLGSREGTSEIGFPTCLGAASGSCICLAVITSKFVLLYSTGGEGILNPRRMRRPMGWEKQLDGGITICHMNFLHHQSLLTGAPNP